MIRKDESGQMTVEFAVVLPVIIIIAVIGVNALLFLSECASFDRIARDAIRIYATSPAYGQTTEQSLSQIDQELKSHFDKEYLDLTVSVSGDNFGQVTFTAELLFSPTLFGKGMRGSVFGVSLPRLNHSVSMTVDRYKPGVFL